MAKAKLICKSESGLKPAPIDVFFIFFKVEIVIPFRLKNL